MLCTLVKMMTILDDSLQSQSKNIILSNYWYSLYRYYRVFFSVYYMVQKKRYVTLEWPQNEEITFWINSECTGQQYHATKLIRACLVDEIGIWPLIRYSCFAVKWTFTDRLMPKNWSHPFLRYHKESAQTINANFFKIYPYVSASSGCLCSWISVEKYLKKISFKSLNCHCGMFLYEFNYPVLWLSANWYL